MATKTRKGASRRTPKIARKRRSSGPDFRTAEGLLAAVRAFLFDEGIALRERGKAWDVLSALRGPDFHDELLKASTTAIVRATVLDPGGTAAGPRGRVGVRQRFIGPMSVMANGDAEAFVDVRRRWADGDVRTKPNVAHFVRHARGAFEALGLEWDAENP